MININFNSDLFKGILDSYINKRIGGWAKQGTFQKKFIITWIDDGVIVKAAWACVNRIDLSGDYGFYFDNVNDKELLNITSVRL